MIKAEKHSLEWQLTQGKVQAFTRELEFLLDVLTQIMNMATFVAGFGSLGIGVDMLEVYESYTVHDEFAWRKHVGRVCTYLSSLTLFLSLWVICTVLSVVPNARRWALEGPVESVEDAVRKLKAKLNTITNVFVMSLFTFILERIGNCTLFDATMVVSPFMFFTGGIAIGFILREYRMAARMFSDSAELKHRAFPQRPPESYRELGRMERMSVMLGPQAAQRAQPLAAPVAGRLPKAGNGSTTSGSGPLPLPRPGAPTPAGPLPAPTNSHVYVTRVVNDREVGYARRYAALEGHRVVLYDTYEDYILNLAKDGQRVDLRAHKLAELRDVPPLVKGGARMHAFELDPLERRAGLFHRPESFRFRVESAKTYEKWVSALRCAYLELDAGGERAQAAGSAAVAKGGAGCVAAGNSAGKTSASTGLPRSQPK